MIISDPEKEINEITEGFLTSFGDSDVKQLNWKPDEGTWSIAQNMDHLIILNQSYQPTFDALKSGEYKAPAISKIGFLNRGFGKMLLQAVAPGQKRKTKTFEMWQPSVSMVGSDILLRFQQHQQWLKEEINTLSPFVKEGVVISSPANKWINYSLEDAISILITHEKRHFIQALNVKEMVM